MKAILRIVVFLMVACAISDVAFCAPVSKDVAMKIAFNHLKNRGVSLSSTSLSLVYTKMNAFYVFGNAKSFVIVSADDRVTPILGYSTESPFILPKTPADTLSGTSFWGAMHAYEQQISYAADNTITASTSISNQWSKLSTGLTTKSAAIAVAPLLTTSWGQGWPYNALCPADVSGPGGHVMTGCVATAIAQIMNYHKYPSKGLGTYGYTWSSYPATNADFGSTSYNWTNMPASISTQNNDIATLMYQTAVSCRSMWGPGSTGVSYLNNEDPMTRALVNYFGYAFAPLKFVSRSSYKDTDWEALIQNELSNNRPVYYRGDGVGSHAWVCDGYDGAGMYHFNWGWDGNYNGYFALSTIAPGSNTFTNNQEAIIGIRPNDGSTLVTNTTWAGNITNASSIAVPDAITLTVQAGATIKFAASCKLQVWGRLVSNGSAGSMITYTAMDATTGWNGIKFDNNYQNHEVMADNEASSFTYSQIEYSKMRGVTIKYFDKVSFDYCRFNNNSILNGDEFNYYNGQGAGIGAFYSTLQLTNSELINNHSTSYGGGFVVGSDRSPDFLISGNTISQNISDGTGGGFAITTNGIFSNNIVSKNQGGAGAGGYIAGGVGVTDIRVTNNKFVGNATGNKNKGGALYLDYRCPAIFVDNLIANNFAGSGGAISCFNTSSPLFLNTTIVNNTTSYISTIALDQSSSPIFKNCIFSGNTNGSGKEFFLNTGCAPTFDHCDVQSGLTSYYGGGIPTFTSCIVANPLFISPSSGVGSAYDGLNANWQLQSSSLCINAGEVTGIQTLLPTFDLGGNTRLNGSIDIGAYEYGCAPLLVSLTIAASTTPPLCVGTVVTFTAVPSNGGSTPIFQWKKNGTLVGTNASTYAYAPVNGDIISCVLTSNATCTTGNPASSNSVTMTVNVVNRAPIANAGLDQSVLTGTLVKLNGSSSYDPDGSALTYKWTVPTGITLSSKTVVLPTFTAPSVTKATSYTLSLIVNDGKLSSTADNIIITVNPNRAPIANAGPDQAVISSGKVLLNGSSSYDPDGSALTYKWTAPIGITLSSKTVVAPTFTAPSVTRATSYTLSLVVSDGKLSSITDNIIVTVAPSTKSASIEASTTVTPIQQENLKILIYPNPCHGRFQIQSSQSLSRVILYDMSGKIVSQVDHPDDGYMYEHSGYSSGLYIVHIITSDARHVIKKVIFN